MMTPTSDAMHEKQRIDSKLMLNLVLLTVVVTTAVILVWDWLLRAPLQAWIDTNYPGRWKLAEGAEILCISSIVNMTVMAFAFGISIPRRRQPKEEHYRPAIPRKSSQTLNVVFSFVVLTVVLTWGVIVAWERLLRVPFYSWVEKHYPPQMHWVIEQRTEHFIISSAVDVIVVTLLLRLVNRQQRGLRISEERFRAVFEHAGDGIGVLSSADHTFIEANNKLGELLRNQPAQLIGRGIGDLIASEGENPDRAAFLSRLDNERSGEIELRIRTSQGYSLPVSLSWGRLRMDGHSLVALIIRDLSERKRSEEALKKLSSVVEQTDDTVTITDKNGIIEYVNPAFEKLTGYTREEVLGRTPSILKSGKHLHQVYETLWSTILNGQTYRNILVNKKKDGEFFYEEKTLTPLRDKYGNTTHFVATGKDITERIQAEEALRDSEARYRLLFENNPLPMWVFDSETLQFVDVNESAVRHYGYSRKEFLSMSITDIRPPEDVPVLLSNLASTKDHVLNFAGLFRHRKKNGTIITVEIISHKLIFDGRPAECVLPNDITERTRLEQEKEEMQRQLYQSSKLASIGELSAGVAHEIGNPINSIINFGQLLKDDGVGRTDSQQRMIDGIISEGERIARIVHDLLAFARRDSHDLTRVNIAETVNNSVMLFGRQLESDGITVELNLERDLPPVMAIGSLLRQVVVNMITNARQALRAKASTEKTFRISARAQRSDGQRSLVMEFYDNGIGIKAENIDKVFDPFFTTRRDTGGTGLGLSLSFGIIRNFGGTITVESVSGNHTCFRVELPTVGSWEDADNG